MKRGFDVGNFYKVVFVLALVFATYSFATDKGAFVGNKILLNPPNLISNGNFEISTGWSSSSLVLVSRISPTNYILDSESLGNGRTYYVDRAYRITQDLPSILIGHKVIKTANSDRQAVSFLVNKDVRIFLAWDNRATIPSGWTISTSSRVYVSDSGASGGGYLQLYYKDFTAGEVSIPVLPSNNNGNSNYIIFIIDKGTTSIYNGYLKVNGFSLGVQEQIPLGSATETKTYKLSFNILYSPGNPQVTV